MKLSTKSVKDGLTFPTTLQDYKFKAFRNSFFKPHSKLSTPSKTLLLCSLQIDKNSHKWVILQTTLPLLPTDPPCIFGQSRKEQNPQTQEKLKCQSKVNSQSVRTHSTAFIPYLLRWHRFTVLDILFYLFILIGKERSGKQKRGGA